VRPEAARGCEISAEMNPSALRRSLRRIEKQSPLAAIEWERLDLHEGTNERIHETTRQSQRSSSSVEATEDEPADGSTPALKCEIWEKWGATYGRNGWVGEISDGSTPARAAREPRRCNRAAGSHKVSPLAIRRIEQTDGLRRLVQQGREMANAKDELVAAVNIRLGRYQSQQALSDAIKRMVSARECAEGVGAYGGREATQLETRLALATRLLLAKEQVAEALGRCYSPGQEVDELRAMAAVHLAPVVTHAADAMGGRFGQPIPAELSQLRKRLSEVETLAACKEEMGAALALQVGPLTTITQLDNLLQRLQYAFQWAERLGASKADAAEQLRRRIHQLRTLAAAKRALLTAAACTSGLVASPAPRAKVRLMPVRVGNRKARGSTAREELGGIGPRCGATTFTWLTSAVGQWFSIKQRFGTRRTSQGAVDQADAGAIEEIHACCAGLEAMESAREDAEALGVCGGLEAGALEESFQADISPTHPFLPYVAPHFSHISHFNLVF